MNLTRFSYTLSAESLKSYTELVCCENLSQVNHQTDYLH